MQRSGLITTPSDANVLQFARGVLNRAEKIPLVWPCWFHTHFVENGALTLAKHELDKACKCKKASPDLRVSIKFRPPPRSKRAPSPNNVVP